MDKNIKLNAADFILLLYNNNIIKKFHVESYYEMIQTFSVYHEDDLSLKKTVNLSDDEIKFVLSRFEKIIGNHSSIDSGFNRPILGECCLSFINNDLYFLVTGYDTITDGMFYNGESEIKIIVKELRQYLEERKIKLPSNQDFEWTFERNIFKIYSEPQIELGADFSKNLYQKLFKSLLRNCPFGSVDVNIDDVLDFKYNFGGEIEQGEIEYLSISISSKWQDKISVKDYFSSSYVELNSKLFNKLKMK